MSALVSVLVFLVSLPLSVWLLSHILGLLDEDAQTRPLIRIALTAIAVLTFLLLTERGLWVPMAGAFALVTVLHVAYFYAFRSALLGVPLYDRSPPPPEPVLTEVEGEIRFGS